VMEAVAETQGMTREELAGRLTELTVHDDASAAEAIDQLHSQGLLNTDDQGTVGLTAKGKALSDKVIADRSELRTQLYGGIPSDDFATTKRVLDLIRERATSVHTTQ
jgi:Mn-dependent DtxR family transcriptional regulator